MPSGIADNPSGFALDVSLQRARKSYLVELQGHSKIHTEAPTQGEDSEGSSYLCLKKKFQHLPPPTSKDQHWGRTVGTANLSRLWTSEIHLKYPMLGTRLYIPRYIFGPGTPMPGGNLKGFALQNPWKSMKIHENQWKPMKTNVPRKAFTASSHTSKCQEVPWPRQVLLFTRHWFVSMSLQTQRKWPGKYMKILETFHSQFPTGYTDQLKRSVLTSWQTRRPKPTKVGLCLLIFHSCRTKRYFDKININEASMNDGCYPISAAVLLRFHWQSAVTARGPSGFLHSVLCTFFLLHGGFPVQVDSSPLKLTDLSIRSSS